MSTPQWNRSGERAFARCQGYDLVAEWGTGRDFARAAGERESTTPGAELPGETDAGIVIRVRSPHRQVDNIIMLPTEHDGTPEEALLEFTKKHDPESLLPQRGDWIDEWSWIADYRNKSRWQRHRCAATGFIGHLVLTVTMTTTREGMQRIQENLDPGRAYEASPNLQEKLEEFGEDSPVFLMEVREDLSVILSWMTRAQDEGTRDIREYARKNDPALILTGCIAQTYGHQPGTKPAPGESV